LKNAGPGTRLIIFLILDWPSEKRGTCKKWMQRPTEKVPVEERDVEKGLLKWGQKPPGGISGLDMKRGKITISHWGIVFVTSGEDRRVVEGTRTASVSHNRHRKRKEKCGVMPSS